MGRKARDTERGARVVREKEKRKRKLQAMFARKERDPNLPLRRLAREAGMGHSQLCERWNKYKVARDDRERMAACENHSGGHNRAFTPDQASLLREQVLACPTASRSTVHDYALEMKNAIVAEGGALHAHMPLLRAHRAPFAASPSFLTRWMRAQRVSVRRTKKVHERKHAEAEPRDLDRESEEFLVKVNCAIVNFGASRVMNMDETPAQLVEAPRTALRPTGSKECAKITTQANERLNITTFPTITASGHKLPICAIIRGKTPRTLEKITAGASEAVKKVKLYYSETGWTNTGIMVRWLNEIIKPYLAGRPGAMILDDYAAHWTTEVCTAAEAMQLMLIPVPNFKGATALLQPLDVQYNGLLKAKRMMFWTIARVRDPDAKDSDQAAIERVQLAYEAMTAEHGIEAFRKAGIAV
jgi:DDE superfamily endonuclease